MPEKSRFFGIVIKMFFDDHTPTHFYAEYGSDIALIDIRNLSVFSGRLPFKPWNKMKPDYNVKVLAVEDEPVELAMAERSRKKPSSKQPKSFKEITLDEISTDNFIF